MDISWDGFFYIDDFNIFQWELSEHIFSESLFLEGFYLGIWATGLGLNLKRLLDFSGNDPLLDLHKRLPNMEGKNPLFGKWSTCPS